MGKRLHFIGGFVRIRLLGRNPERFLNLCANRRLQIWDLKRKGAFYELNLSIKDFFKLEPVSRKSGTRAKILGRYGMPFFFQKHRKRKAFFAGIFLCAALLLLLSQFIWNIHVDGNYANSTRSILTFLESQGIRHGMAKRQVDCAEAASAIREAFPDVTWVSAKIRGTRLLIEIKENVDGYPEAEEKDSKATDLTAEKSGVVESIVTRSGRPLVSAGDSCQKGEILVSGQIPIKNDSGEIVRWEQVRADADIKIRWTSYYYDEFSRQYTQRTYLDNGRTMPYLEILGFRLDFFRDGGDACDYLAEEHQVFLTENFALPIRYGTVRSRPYTEEQKIYSEREAEALAGERLAGYVENLEKTGVEILEKNVKIEISDTDCRSSGTLTVRSRSAKESASRPMKSETDPGKEEAE